MHIYTMQSANSVKCAQNPQCNLGGCTFILNSYIQIHSFYLSQAGKTFFKMLLDSHLPLSPVSEHRNLDQLFAPRHSWSHTLLAALPTPVLTECTTSLGCTAPEAVLLLDLIPLGIFQNYIVNGRLGYSGMTTMSNVKASVLKVKLKNTLG